MKFDEHTIGQEKFINVLKNLTKNFQLNYAVNITLSELLKCASLFSMNSYEHTFTQSCHMNFYEHSLDNLFMGS